MKTFESYYKFGDFLEDYKFDELSKYLRSYSQNKNVINSMAEGNISMHALIFCCWCETEIIHNIIRYILNYLYNYMRCENTLSCRFFKVSNEIYWCVHPALDNIIPYSSTLQNMLRARCQQGTARNWQSYGQWWRNYQLQSPPSLQQWQPFKPRLTAALAAEVGTTTTTRRGPACTCVRTAIGKVYHKDANYLELEYNKTECYTGWNIIFTKEYDELGCIFGGVGVLNWITIIRL